jgi:hypothetical protein
MGTGGPDQPDGQPTVLEASDLRPLRKWEHNEIILAIKENGLDPRAFSIKKLGNKAYSDSGMKIDAARVEHSSTCSYFDIVRNREGFIGYKRVGATRGKYTMSQPGRG